MAGTGGHDGPLRPPAPHLLALEGRSGFELLASLTAMPFLELGPRGDGHPVLVVPGWLASDRSTLFLRWFLRRRGYHAHGWKLGTNRGPSSDVLRGLAERFRAIRARHGRKPSLVGWSLGGIYARELARYFPDDVRQVITLGSPFRALEASNVSWLSRFVGRAPDRPELRARIAEPITVPTTSIYSRTDGVVAWRSCVSDETHACQNVEIVSSHIGMGHHPVALAVIADRLAQPEGEWRPFRPGFWRGWAVVA